MAWRKGKNIEKVTHYVGLMLLHLYCELIVKVSWNFTRFSYQNFLFTFMIYSWYLYNTFMIHLWDFHYRYIQDTFMSLLWYSHDTFPMVVRKLNPRKVNPKSEPTKTEPTKSEPENWTQGKLNPTKTEPSENWTPRKLNPAQLRQLNLAQFRKLNSESELFKISILCIKAWMLWCFDALCNVFLLLNGKTYKSNFVYNSFIYT